MSSRPFPFNPEQLAAILRIRHSYYSDGKILNVFRLDGILGHAGMPSMDIYRATGDLLSARSEATLEDCDQILKVTGSLGDETLHTLAECMQISLKYSAI
jgi:hypothetical protein